MASSSYYYGRMNDISSQITKKKNRRRTCETVKNNLTTEYTYSDVNLYANRGSTFLESGITGVSISAPDSVQQDKENSPGADGNLSAAISALQTEINTLNNSIDSLQADYNAARNSYYSAKRREWQEYLDSLKPKKD